MERLNHPVIIESNALEPVTTFYVEPNNTIGEILELAKIPKAIYPNVVVIMNGIEVTRDQWDFVEPRDEDIIGLHVIPLGGDGAKGILRMVALIAVAIAIPQLALNVAALTTVNAAGATVLTIPGMFAVAGATLVASLAINAIIPPPKPTTASQSAAGDAYFINSQSNRARINETIPIVYGMHKLYANLATAPSIFSAGTSSMFTSLYDWGLGNLDVWDIRAGDTSISKFGAQIRHLKNVPNHYDPDQPNLGLEPVELEIVNYPTKSTELNVELNKNNDTGTPTTAPNSKSAVVELSFPQGLVKFDKQGNEQRLAIQFNMQMRGPSSNYEWVNLPSGTRGYAGDHFQISGGFLGNDIVRNPNEPASVSVILDEYAISSGQKVFVRLRFNQPTYFIRPQSDLWFIDAENSQRVPQFDFNETPNPDDYPDDWLLVTGDQPAKGVFVINEGREYGFEFLSTGVSDGYYVCRTNLENFKDDVPPDGFNFPAGIVNSEQLVVGQQGGDGEVIDPPISGTLYSLEVGNETYLRVIQTQTSARGELGRWTEVPTSSQLFYRGQNIPVDVALVPEYKGQLKFIDDPQEVYGGVKIRSVYYALKVAPSNVSSYGGTSPAFDFDIDYTGDIVTRSSFNISGNKLTPGRVSLVIPFAVEGEYELIIKRVGDHENYNGDDRYIEKCSLTRLTSRGYPINELGERRGILNLKKKHTMTELQFQASGNVQGNVQQVSGMVRQYLRWHDGIQWREPEIRPAISSNPAYIVLDILTGYSIQNSTDIPSKLDFDGGWISDKQIDFRTFKLFADHCNEKVKYIDKYQVEQERFRYQISTIIASEAPIIETVNNILSMCRAQLIMNQQGQVSVMLDSNYNLDGSEKVARQLFTSQNSWNFNASRNFVDLPHSFNVSFTDPNLGYQQGNYEVFRPGYNERNSTIFEDIGTFGVTHWHQAAQWGMYQLAQGVMRSETFTINVDVESLVVQRGDIVEIQHDAPIVGGTSAVVTSVDGLTLGISEEFGMVTDAGYTLRTGSGDVFTGECVCVGRVVTLDVERIGASAGDVIVIGTRNADGEVTQKYIISEVVPKSDLTAELKMGVFNPDLYTTDDGGFPSYDPNFGQTDEESGYHVIEELEGFSFLEIDETQPYTVSAMKWKVDPVDNNVHRFLIEFIKTGSTEKQFVQSIPATISDDGYFRTQHKYWNSDTNFGSGQYSVTPLSTLGYFGKGESIYLSKVYDRGVPNRPVPFYVERLVISDAMRFIWTPSSSDNDIAGYTIYRMPEGSKVFDIGVAELYQRIDNGNSNSWEDMLVDGAFWIVAVDTSGNESIVSSESILWTLIKIICGNPDWLGNKSNLITEGEELLLDPESPSFLISNKPPQNPEVGDLWWKVEVEGNARNGWVGVYDHDDVIRLEQPANLMIKSYIQTSTDLDQIVIADQEWNPMSNIDPLSWQPNGIDFDVYHEASVDDGPWRRIHNQVVRGQRVKFRLVVISYKEQDLRVQRACIHIHSTKNIL
jgi:hypothetical protein